MKKSFCDICGEEARVTDMLMTYKGIELKISPRKLDEAFEEYENQPWRSADLCKKCARELLDKIEL